MTPPLQRLQNLVIYRNADCSPAHWTVVRNRDRLDSMYQSAEDMLNYEFPGLATRQPVALEFREPTANKPEAFDAEGWTFFGRISRTGVRSYEIQTNNKTHTARFCDTIARFAALSDNAVLDIWVYVAPPEMAAELLPAP